MPADARSQVEAAVDDEQRSLAELANVIRARVPIEAWPPELSAALALALVIDETNPGDARKARALRRHLAGPSADVRCPAPSTTPTDQQRRNAERVRADLAHLVPLRALASAPVDRDTGDG